MDWKKYRRTTEATSDDEQIGYIIRTTRRGKIRIEAYLAGGREHQLPYKNFDAVEEAQEWVNEYEAKRAEQNARYADEKPISI